ncbi:MAG: DUF411 domain-containing protein [Gemmatimonadaceae bacterium]|nr:DUF411 domain-containing protein [Gemmatimonadaceae bacterium]
MTHTSEESVAAGRRSFLRAAALLVGGGAVGAAALSRVLEAQAGQPAIKQMVVYKDPNCGCCKAWIEHVRKAGFVVDVKDTSDMDSVKTSMGLPAGLASCHTAKVGSYLVEGHVPADLIVKLLKDKPATARGLAVPGMPVGSPGMEMGDRKDPFDVLLFDKAGKTSVYAKR